MSGPAETIEAARAAIRARAAGRAPRVALVLGSGLRDLADGLEDRLAIAYSELPGFPQATVEGHGRDLVLGRIGGREVAAMTGRAHYYESGRPEAMRVPLGALRALGCEVLILTNAAASLRAEAGPGSLMVITDHINMGGTNPLIGQGDDTRFVDMTDAYDPGLRAQLLARARDSGIALHQGVYMWFSGPSFETPAEIRMAQVLGADAAGMSTVPETIIARLCGFRVLAISAITNLGAGLDGAPLDHAHTIAHAARSVADLSRLLEAFLRDLDGVP